jgi:hypothetical protein
MDISAIVVVLVLTALSFGAIVWMEIYSGKTSSKEPRGDAKSRFVEQNDRILRFIRG